MEYKLYVGNLAYSVSETDLQTLFAEAGAVKSVALIKDKFTSQSKGFAFVEMENQQDMQNAITVLNGREFQGRALAVSVARPKEDRGGFGGGGGGGGYGNNRGGGNGKNAFNDRNKRKPRGGNQKQRW
jgi:RNA recognition motif-containing protein